MAKFLLLAFLFGSIFYALYKRLTRTASDAPKNTSPTPPKTTLSPTEAAEILGVPADASEDEIREAHRRLMKHIHPDGGGNNYFATRLNLARDTLLKKK